MMNALSGGGAEKVLRDILYNINTEKYNIDIILIFKTGVYLDEIEEKFNIKSIISEKDSNSNDLFTKIKRKVRLKILTSTFGINKFIPNKYDIEIAFMQGMTTEIISKRKNDAKKIAWIHIDMLKRKEAGYVDKKDKYIYSKFDKIVAVSNDSANSFIKLYKQYREKVNVIYNPVDKNLIYEKSNEKNISYESNSINLITLGRLDRQKGYDILLEAHNQLIKEGYKHDLYILGQGDEYNNLKSYIDKENLNNSAHLLGFKKNPYPYLKKADVFISSSRYEGFALVIAESMILGKPIIATNCTGPRELLKNGEFGILSKVENVESLKKAMKEMILSSEKRNYYSAKSLERSKLFDLDKTMIEIENLFDNI